MLPDSPFGGHDVPNTGVRNLCSIDRSRGHFSGWRSGKSQCAPVAPGSNRSRGTDGRSSGFRSAPQPGMRARNSSLDSASFGFSDVYGMVVLRQDPLGTMRGLMQPSSFAEKMW